MSWSVSVYVEGFPVPRSAVLASMTVTHGRTDPTTQPAPATATVSFLTDTAEPDWFQLGHSLAIYTWDTDPDYVATLFTGYLTDCTMDRSTLTVTATSSGLGRLARTVGAITTAAGTVLDVYDAAGVEAIDIMDNGFIWFDSSGPSDSALVATDWPRQPLLQTFQDIVGNDPGGVFVEQPDGVRVVFVTGKGRQAAYDTRTAVSGAAVVDSWTATKSLATKCNRARVTYDDPPATVTARDTDDISLFGVFDRDVQTRLELSADASYLARYYVARGVHPGWTVPTITVDADRWTETEWFVFNGLVTSVLEFDTVPTPYLPAAVCIEGWTHRREGRSWFIDFFVSDPTLSLPNQSWEDLADSSPTLSWSSVPATTSWDDLLTSDL